MEIDHRSGDRGLTMDIIIEPKKLKGTVKAIPSKSAAHRLLICAALADRPTTLYIDKTSDDITATAQCLKALGAGISINGDAYHITPIEDPAASPTLDCGESGSTLRFLLPVAAALGNGSHFIGRGRLPQRPLSDLTAAMKEHGISMDSESLPMTLNGTLRGGTYRIKANVSSQYITGLLLALPLAEEDSVIELTTETESASYIDITLSALNLFGVEIETMPNGYRIKGGQTYHSPEAIIVEGDWSNGAFFLTAAAIGNELTVTGLDPASAQGDRKIIDLLSQIGNDASIDIRDTPDLLPILSVAATQAKGTTTFVNAARLRLKESDRLESTADLINALGGKAETTEDTLTVYGTGLVGGSIDSCNDHRIAMSAAIAATACSETVTIRGAEAVNKSYPAFFEDYNKLGGNAHGISMGK